MTLYEETINLVNQIITTGSSGINDSKRLALVVRLKEHLQRPEVAIPQRTLKANLERVLNNRQHYMTTSDFINDLIMVVDDFKKKTILLDKAKQKMKSVSDSVQDFTIAEDGTIIRHNFNDREK